MPSGFVWNSGPAATIGDGMDRYTDAMRREVAGFATAFAAEAEAYARRNHPWRNVTGRAERGLEGFVRVGRDRVATGLRQNDRDRVGLEYWRGGREAIILPTLRKLSPRWREFLASRGLR